MKFFSTIASLAACASAYTVLTPTLNSTIAKGSTVNVQFSSVDTDPSSFSVYLVNFQTGHFPPEVLSLAQNVQKSAGSVNVRIPCSVSSDYGYQLNFINGTNTYVIYAQSAKFSLTGDCVDPVASTAGTFTNSSIAGVNVQVNVVTSIVYPNPVLWFVQPGAVQAVCPVSTVTIIQGAGMVAPAAAVTVTATVTKTVALACAVTTTAAAAGNVVAVPAAAAPVVAASVALQASVVASTVAQTTGAGVFVSGASSTQISGVLAMIAAGAFALLL